MRNPYSPYASDAPDVVPGHIDRLYELANYLYEQGCSFILIGCPGAEIGALNLGQMLDAIERLVLAKEGLNIRDLLRPGIRHEPQDSNIRAEINRRLAAIHKNSDEQFALLTELDGEQWPTLDFHGYDPDQALSELATLLLWEIQDEMDFYDLAPARRINPDLGTPMLMTPSERRQAEMRQAATLRMHRTRPAESGSGSCGSTPGFATGAQSE
jgi:hypothetical protein